MSANLPARECSAAMQPPVAVMLAKSPVLEPYVRRDARGQNAFSSVVAGVTGGAPLGHDVVAQVYSRLGFRVRLGYGLTEACSVTLQSGLDEASMTANRDDTGRPHWGVEITVQQPSLRVAACGGPLLFTQTFGSSGLRAAGCLCLRWHAD